MKEPRRVETMKLKGNEYAKVSERLKVFWETFPHGKIETEHSYLEDGTVEFKCWIWKEKSEYIEMLKATKDSVTARGSSDADGNSRGQPTNEKDFEKQQTIAVGRALAMLGFLSSGEIASFEEMEEFSKFKAEQHQSGVNAAIEAFQQAKTIEELRAAFIGSGLMNDKDVVAAKDARKNELSGDKNGDS